MIRNTPYLAVVLLAAFWAGAALADDGDEEDDVREHAARESVRQGVERGELKSLADVLAIVQPSLPGEVVGIEIEDRHGIWVYEFRVTDSKGRLFDVYVDAATAKIVNIKEK